MTVGERIKHRRIELGLSADDLAESIGKNRATIYRYESSEILDLPTSVLVPLAKALNTSPAYLMGWTPGETTLKYESDSLILSECEKKIITAYRNMPEMQSVIKKLLDINDK